MSRASVRILHVHCRPKGAGKYRGRVAPPNRSSSHGLLSGGLAWQPQRGRSQGRQCCQGRRAGGGKRARKRNLWSLFYTQGCRTVREISAAAFVSAGGSKRPGEVRRHSYQRVDQVAGTDPCSCCFRVFLQLCVQGELV